MDGAAWPWSFGDSEKVPDVQIKWIWSKRSNLKNWTRKVSPMLFLSDRVHCTVITVLSNCSKCHHCSILHVLNVITVLPYMSSLLYPTCHHCSIPQYWMASLFYPTVLNVIHRCSNLQYWMSSLFYPTILLSLLPIVQHPGGERGEGGGGPSPTLQFRQLHCYFLHNFLHKKLQQKRDD